MFQNSDNLPPLVKLAPASIGTTSNGNIPLRPTKIAEMMEYIHVSVEWPSSSVERSKSCSSYLEPLLVADFARKVLAL